MLRKILVRTVAVCAATLLMSADALAWGACGGYHGGSGSWNRSGSASYTGRGGNTFPGVTPAPAADITVAAIPAAVAITMAAAITAAAIIMGAARTPLAVEDIMQGGFTQEVSSLVTRPESIVPSSSNAPAEPVIVREVPGWNDG